MVIPNTIRMEVMASTFIIMSGIVKPENELVALRKRYRRI